MKPTQPETVKRFTVYRNQVNSLAYQILHSDQALTPTACRITAESLYNRPFRYDGRCGRYCIYKTDVDKSGAYLVMHIQTIPFSIRD